MGRPLRAGRRLALCVVILGALMSPLVGGTTAGAASTMAFGFNATPDADSGRAASDIQPGSVVRVGVEWSAIQNYCWTAPSLFGPAQKTWSRWQCSQPGPKDWGYLDNLMAKLAPYDVKILPVLVRAPQWAWGYTDRVDSSVDHPIMPPGDDNQTLQWWQGFVQELVGHMQSQSYWPRIAGLEIWSEENGTTSWSTSAGPDPARYARMLCRAYHGAKWVAPNLKVIMGGLYAEERTTAGKMRIPDFLRTAYGTSGPNIGGCMDSIGVHPYPAWTNDRPPSDPTSNFTGALQQARSAAVDAGDAGRPLSITEFGYHPDLNGLHPTLQDQADWETQAYNLAAAMPDVDMFIVHSLFMTVDNAHICASPGVPRPAATAFKQLLRGGTAAATC